MKINSEKMDMLVNELYGDVGKYPEILENQRMVYKHKIYTVDVLDIRPSSEKIKCKGTLYEGDVLDFKVRKGGKINLRVIGCFEDGKVKTWIAREKIKFSTDFLELTDLIEHDLPKEIRDDIDAFAEYRERFTNELSVEAYTYALKKFYEIIGKYPEKLTTDDIEKFLEKYGKKVEMRTVAHRIIILRAYFEWKKRKDLVEFLDEEAKHYRRLEKNEPVFFTKEDIKNIFIAAGTIKKKKNKKITKTDILKAKRDKAIVAMLYHTGIRGAELGNLKRSDIRENGDGYKIIVKQGKGRKDRRVLLQPEAKKFLDEYMKMRKDGKEWLFLSKYGRRLSIDSLEWVLKNIYKKAGLFEKYPGERLGTHSLRRAFATHLYRDGYDIYDLSKLLGHSSIVTTQRYIGLDEERAFESFKKIKKNVL